MGVPVLLGVRPWKAGSRCCSGCAPSPSVRGGRPGRHGAADGRRAGRAGTGRCAAAGGRRRGGGRLGGGDAGLRHAAETATAAQGLSDRPWYDARRLDIDLLLWRLRDHPDLAAFVDRAIGPLREHDRSSRPTLLPTLEVYLAHAGRKAETARELHLNRQTLYNRLARIAELLGTDLDDPQTVLALSLALRARRHTPVTVPIGPGETGRQRPAAAAGSTRRTRTAPGQSSRPPSAMSPPGPGPAVASRRRRSGSARRRVTASAEGRRVAVRYEFAPRRRPVRGPRRPPWPPGARRATVPPARAAERASQRLVSKAISAAARRSLMSSRRPMSRTGRTRRLDTPLEPGTLPAFARDDEQRHRIETAPRAGRVQQGV